MSPIKSQTCFMQELESLKARHEAELSALITGQRDYKKAIERLELIKLHGATSNLKLYANFCNGRMDLVAYASHHVSGQRSIYDAILATGLSFTIEPSHSDDKRDIVFDDCPLRIVFYADIVLGVREVA